jgi:hypothetical protein
MSTAMQIAHTRNQDLDLAQGSERVQQRTIQLIQRTQLPLIQAKLHALSETITTGTGRYQSFLERWGYDAEQRIAIQQVLQRVTI